MSEITDKLNAALDASLEGPDDSIDYIGPALRAIVAAVREIDARLDGLAQGPTE